MKTSFWMLVLALLIPTAAFAQRNAPADAPFVFEHSYWISPGQTERFVELFNRNKLPLLRREMSEGRILWMRMTRPRLRSADPAQSDFRLTIAWRDAAAAWDDFDPARFVAQLFPDAERHAREEQQREELVLRRSDLPVQEVTITRE